MRQRGVIALLLAAAFVACASGALEHAPDGGLALVWRREPESIQADDTPAGRACLAKANAKCRADPIHYHRGAVIKRWLDGQLTPGRVDQQASSELAAVVEKNRGSSSDGGTLEVECVAEFCRARSNDPELIEKLPGYLSGSDTHQLLRFGKEGLFYIARDGWRFPGAF